ncbi:uncharacterized protein LOC144134766 isoform X2 [Amblyomma americanum]
MSHFVVVSFFCALTALSFAEQTEDLSNANEILQYKNPSKVLSYQNTVYLFRAPDGWHKSNSMCLRSNYVSSDDAKKEYIRTAQYYGMGVHRRDFGPVNIKVLMRIVTTGLERKIEAIEVTEIENPSFPNGNEDNKKPEKTTAPKPERNLKPRNLDDKFANKKQQKSYNWG